MEKHKRPGNELNFDKRYSMAFKKQVVEPVLNGQMSQRFAANKHGLHRNTVASWCREFNTQMSEKNQSKNKEIKKLKDKIEELELLKDIQQDMLAILQKETGTDVLEKYLPEQLFKEIQKAGKKFK
jgi:transposase-like protein